MNYEDKLFELAAPDERILILTAENRAAIRNMPIRLAERFIDVGIAEQTMIGLAAGLALRGRIPIVHALASFLTMRAFEFIRTDVGIGNLPVKIVGSFAGFLSEANGPTHQAIEDVSLMRGIPNMNIFCPSDEDDMILGLSEIINSPSPFYIRFNPIKSIYSHEEYKIGKAEVIDSGTDIGILVYGTLFNQTLAAKEKLEELGHSVRIVNLRTIKPIDSAELLRTIDECELILTLEDHFVTGGLFSIISEIMVMNKKVADVLPIALNNTWFKPALFNDVLDFEGFTANHIVHKIEEALRNKKFVRVNA